MTCSVCDSKDPTLAGAIIGMQPFCQAHFDRYKDILRVMDITEWPEKIVYARLKYLHRAKDRDMRLLAQLEKGPGKIEIVAETIALVGRNFKEDVSFLKVSEINSQDKITIVHERISADLQDCSRQISEIETIFELTNSNDDIGAQDLQQKGKEREVQTLQEARRIAETLDPKKDKSIDAKEFLSGKIIDLPEPYLIVRDSPLATYQNVMGGSFNNLVTVINILARKYNYKIISTECDNHTMYVFMEKMGSL
jgi:hypothetical protein